MDVDTSNTYYKAISVIEHQQMLTQIQCVSYPNMKKEAQKELYKHISRIAYPDAGKADYMTSEEFAKAMGIKTNG